jgi:threonine/homoserine/homoserine lactone efflux protein
VHRRWLEAIPIGRTTFQGAGQTPLADWRHGLLITFSNPKAAAASASVAAFLYGAGLTPLQVLGSASTLLIDGVYALLFSTGPVQRIQARLARTTEALFGLAFGAIGTRILTDGVHEIVRRRHLNGPIAALEGHRTSVGGAI